MASSSPRLCLALRKSVLRNFDALLREETGLPVFLAEDPLSAVVNGAGMALEELGTLRRVAAGL